MLPMRQPSKESQFPTLGSAKKGKVICALVGRDWRVAPAVGMALLSNAWAVTALVQTDDGDQSALCHL